MRSTAKETCVYSRYSIEKDEEGNLCAVFSHVAPVKTYQGRELISVQYTDSFKETELVERIAMLDSYGFDASMSRDALAILQARTPKMR